MLKKCYRLFLGLLVITGSACVTPTHASSASIIITNVRAGGQSSAAEEGVVLYNNSSFEVEITGWCLLNKSQVKFACITSNIQERIIIPGYSYATIVSTAAQVNPALSFYTAVYEPSNHSSGAIVASSDIISLVDSYGELVDQHSWTSSVTSTQQWVRMKLSALPDLYLDNNTASDWQKVTYVTSPVSQVEYRAIEQVPEEPIDPQNPSEPPLASSVHSSAIVTELLPNAIGSDADNEFIEIYNPNEDIAISLKDYELAVGPAFDKVLTLTDYVLEPGEYKAFTNAELSFSLLNTSSRARLINSSGKVTNEVPIYAAPKENQAWALIGDVWQYTNNPTPNAKNVASSVESEEKDSASVSVPKPCADNQYRSTETNRCRLVSLATPAAQVACTEKQERNTETGRCRNIVSTTSAECKEGQEKNPETNRCRTIKQLSTAGFGVKGASTKQQGGVGWYIWLAIGGVVLMIIGYAAWEWRSELKKLFKTIKAKFAGKVN